MLQESPPNHFLRQQKQSIRRRFQKIRCGGLFRNKIATVSRLLYNFRTPKAWSSATLVRWPACAIQNYFHVPHKRFGCYPYAVGHQRFGKSVRHPLFQEFLLTAALADGLSHRSEVHVWNPQTWAGSETENYGSRIVSACRHFFLEPKWEKKWLESHDSSKPSFVKYFRSRTLAKISRFFSADNDQLTFPHREN